MRRLLLLALLALALPMAAFASSSVDFTNSGGTLSGTSTTGLSLNGSVLTVVNGLNGLGLVTGPNLGSLTFTTPALSSGSLQMGGMFGVSNTTGGTFQISTNGSGGLPNANLFQGQFTGQVSWVMQTLHNGTHQYYLTGTLEGTWVPTGATVDGVTLQLTINTGKGYFNGKTLVSSGDTSITTASVPEPGSLTLLGTGLVGLAGVLRRRIKA